MNAVIEASADFLRRKGARADSAEIQEELVRSGILEDGPRDRSRITSYLGRDQSFVRQRPWRGIRVEGVADAVRLNQRRSEKWRAKDVSRDYVGDGRHVRPRARNASGRQSRKPFSLSYGGPRVRIHPSPAASPLRTELPPPIPMTVDVAVVDFAMPSMNGAALAQAARRLQPGLPIVFASGYANTAAFEAVPGTTILRKPIQLAELADAVRRTFRRHAA